MQIFYRRPLCLLCTVFIAAMFIGVMMPPMFFWGLCMICAAGSFLAVLAVRRQKLSFFRGCLLVSVLVSLLLGCGVSMRFYQMEVSNLEKEAGMPHWVEGQIISREWGGGYYTGYVMHLHTIDGREASADVLLTCEYPASWCPGEVLHMTVDTEAFEVNADGFAERRYYLSRGIVLRMISHDTQGVQASPKTGFSLKIAAAKLNILLAARIEQAVGEDEGKLLSALFLARRNDLDDSVVRDFRRLGLSHLLALSGMHLTLIVQVLKKMLGRLPAKSPVSTLIVLLSVAAYCLLTGAPVSVVRAAAMLAIMEIFSLLWDEGDAQTALFVAVSMICVCNPAALFDIGLWMSAVSTLSLILLSRIHLFSRWPHWLQLPLDMIAATLVATIATLPFVWMIGGELSLLAVPANLVFVPLTSALLYGAPIAALLGRWGTVICWPFAALARAAVWLAENVSRWRGITLSLQYSFLPWILLPLVLVLCGMLIVQIRRKSIFLVPVCLFALCFGIGVVYAQRDPGLDLLYGVDGRNETLTLQGDGGALIFDFTDGSHSALYTAANHARQLGETEVEVLMLTHYHTKHIGAVSRLCDETMVRQIWAPHPSTDREWEILLDLQENAELQGVSVALYRDGEQIRFGKTEIIAHTRERIDRSTQPLLLVQIRHGEQTLTYCGASVHEGETTKTAMAQIAESKIILFGGHGPNWKSSYGLPDCPALEMMIFSTEEVFSCADLANERMADALLGSAVSIADKWVSTPVLRLE